MSNDSEWSLRGRRRALVTLGGGGLLSTGLLASGRLSAAPPSWSAVGDGFSNYGMPPADRRIIRWISAEPSLAGSGASWTPLHELEGSVTPNGLHFERHHGGVPNIDATRWQLTIDGLVGNPRHYDLSALQGISLQSRMAFLECGGNSNSMWRETPVQAPAGWLHGLVSSGEWTGVPLRRILDDAGVRENGRWLIATGLDASGVTVSLERDKLPEDALVALYRNGEPLRPEQGWPARLLLPGLEGICNVKWLGRLEIADRPAMSRYDTVSYTDMGKDGISTRFSRVMGVKSVITNPAVGDTVAPGALAVSGLAWSGAGAISRVEVSIDGGRSWRDADLEGPPLDRAFVRFRGEWQRRDGERVVLQSRAHDTAGRRQPERQALLNERGTSVYYHYNAILSAAIENDGRVVHVHA